MARPGVARLGAARQGRLGINEVVMKSYLYKPGFRAKVDAETAYLEMERVREENAGKLTPYALVSASEPKDAPLHHEFEWRNSVAALRYREWQARNLIRAIRIESVTDDGKNDTLPAFVHTKVITDEGKNLPFYQISSVAVTRVDEWAAAVQEAQVKLSAAKRSLDDLERIAKGADNSDRLAKIMLATRAIETAVAALRH